MFRQGVYDGIGYRSGEAIVIDAGANIGMVTRQLATTAGHVYAIEADPDIYAVLDYNRQHNHWHNVSCHNFALSAEDGQTALHRWEGNPFGATISDELRTRGAAGRDVMVPMKQLGTFMDEREIGHVDFLKLDVEGAEHGVVLSDDFARVAGNIDTILMEWHYIDGAPMFERLLDLGFRQVHSVLPKQVCIYTRRSS